MKATGRAPKNPLLALPRRTLWKAVVALYDSRQPEKGLFDRKKTAYTVHANKGQYSANARKGYRNGYIRHFKTIRDHVI